MTTSTPYAGSTAALVIRALLDFRSLWTTHDLVTTTGIPAPLVRRVINRLEQDTLVRREAPGVVAVPDWLDLLYRWNQDSRFSTEVRTTYWRSKRGVQGLLDRIPGTSVRYALSGTHAAQRWAPQTPNGPTVIYTPDAQLAATTWELVPAKTKSIVLAEPAADVVYIRARKTTDGLRLAAPSQVLSDLLTGAASSRNAGEPLTRWMQENEFEWRY
ncbi:hypothetical protein [Kribbella sp. NPDC004536]|uniref:hypothetical protein n=1 Tax=Kribbella sp. NPDC004536 TaxID=3364106 RepID=UPI0036A2B2A2